MTSASFRNGGEVKRARGLKTTWAELRERDIMARRLGGLRCALTYLSVTTTIRHAAFDDPSRCCGACQVRVLRVSGLEEPSTLRGDVVEMIRQCVWGQQVHQDLLRYADRPRRSLGVVDCLL